MSLESTEIGRIVLITVVVLGYIPMVIMYWRHGAKWIFSAYTALVATAVILLVGIVIDFPFTLLFVRIGLVTSAILFYAAAHQSEQTITRLAEQAERGRIPLEPGDTQ